MRQNKYEYDAFISHAVEDKIPIANELCAKLERAGLKIWYSGKELGIGDSIEKTIEKGLNRSRYGIVIFSPTYLAKNWTIREFYTLLAKEIEEQKVILPVLYNITLDELKNKDLLMADRFAVNADRGIDFVVERLVQEIRKAKVAEPKAAWFSRMWLLLILSLLANAVFLAQVNFSPGDKGVLQLPSSFSPAVPTSSYPAGLIGVMQEFLEQLNVSSCSHARESVSAHPHKNIETNDPPGFSLSEDKSRDDYAPTGHIVQQAAGGKITLAVVFQIETPEPDLDQDTGELPETIDPEESGEPFVAISNRDTRLERCHAGCIHRHHKAD